MLNLTQRTFSKIKNLLLKQKQDLQEELNNLEKSDPVTNNEGLAETVEPGTDSWLAEAHVRTTAIKASIVSLLTKTKESLKKLNSGKYGKCESCGKLIEEERLLVIPTATLCLACSKKASK